ncbi:MAG: hypothetical protein KC441_19105 [Anaerolineales bacterium]|nr:hypothetical protein [Anaerolineales bacterium]
MSDVPCVPVPDAKTITIPLPMGIELRSLTDISKGPPSDCALAHSLMLQISPLLGGMACLLHILEVVKALKSFAESPNPLGSLGDLATATAKAASCFVLLDPVKLCQMVKGILAVILAYIGCLIEAFESIWNFQVGIDLNAAQGNPVLLASLSCAQSNAETSLNSLMQSMEGVQPLIDMVNIIMEIIGQDPIELSPMATPSLSDLAEGVDPLQPVKDVRDVIQAVHDALPC